MLNDSAVLNTKQIVKCGGRLAQTALRHGEHKVAIGNGFVDLAIYHRQPLFGHCGQCRAQAVEAIGDARIVLSIVVAVDIVGQWSGLCEPGGA